jgi:hypothetical protein
MKFRNASVIALGVALTCAGPLTLASEIVIRVPDTAAARSAAGLIARAERAIRRYIDACEFPGTRDPRSVVTSDARVEYSLDEPGTFLSLDASAYLADCATTVASTSQATNVWIYPAGEKNTVFVQFDLPTFGAGTMPLEQIAFVEMRGERIARMRNFGAAPAPLFEAMRSKAQSELCASLKWYDTSLASNVSTRTGYRPSRHGAPIASAP